MFYLTATIVGLNILPIIDVLECRIARDVKLAAQVSVFGTVNSSKNHLR